jgi:DNA-directed RNA polymerase subunit L
MKVEILKDTKKELNIEIEGEDHTFCNALQKVLLEDNLIELAGYNIHHPLISNPIIYIRTKGRRKPENALKEAALKLQTRAKDFRHAFERELKGWQQK